MQHQSTCRIYCPAQAEHIAQVNMTFLLTEEPPIKWVRLGADALQVYVANPLWVDPSLTWNLAH